MLPRPSTPAVTVVIGVVLLAGVAGLIGAGRTELAMSIFGRAYGTRISGELYKDGKPLALNTIPHAIAAGLAYVSEDRKQLGLNLLDTIKRSIVSAKLSKIARGGVIDDSQEFGIAEGYRTGGKTGTTQAYRDAWFIGFSGNYTCAVWFGNDDSSETANLTGGALQAQSLGPFRSVVEHVEGGDDMHG